MGWIQEALREALKRRETADDVEKRSQIEAARLQKQEEMRRLEEIKGIRKGNEELWQQLRSIGAESLLRDVKNQVWHEGDIEKHALRYSRYGGGILGIEDSFAADEEVDGWELRLKHGRFLYGKGNRGPHAYGFLDIGIVELTEEPEYPAETTAIQGVETRQAVKRMMSSGPGYYYWDPETAGWVHESYVVPGGLSVGRYFHLLSGQFSRYQNYYGEGKIDLEESEAWVAVDDKQAKDKIKDFLLKDCEARILKHILPRDLEKGR